jgi:primosomal protein N' (replication factor Y)
MTQYVEIAVNVPQVSGVFHYHLPAELEGRVIPGHLVVAPFGQQTVQGVVIRFIDEPEVSYTKAVESILDEEVSLTSSQIELARYLSESTLAPLAACIGLMIPPGIGQRADTLYALTGKEIPKNLELNSTATQLIEVLRKRGSLRGRQIDRTLPRRNWRHSVHKLVETGILESKTILPPPRVRPKFIRDAGAQFGGERTAAPPATIAGAGR